MHILSPEISFFFEDSYFLCDLKMRKKFYLSIKNIWPTCKLKKKYMVFDLEAKRKINKKFYKSHNRNEKAFERLQKSFPYQNDPNNDRIWNHSIWLND